MRFLLDENISKSITSFLTQLGHTPFRIKKISPGAEDFKVLALAEDMDAVLITLDKDYGELVFKEGKPHTGVIFLRLNDQTTGNAKRVIAWFLSKYPKDKIINNFVVITEEANGFKARFGKKKLQN